MGLHTGKEARESVHGVQTNCVNWPSLAELRAKFEAKYGKQQWTHADVTAWPGPTQGQRTMTTYRFDVGGRLGRSVANLPREVPYL